MRNKKYEPIIYSLLIIAGIFLGDKLSNKDQLENQHNKLNSILELIEEHYLDTINTEEFEEKIISSVLEELDPHSNYIAEKDFKTINESMKGSFSGIGVEFNIIADSIVVIAPISGGPSERLGILSGDRIVFIEEESMTGIDIQNKDVISRLRGKKGDPVSIKIFRREVKELLDFTIIRDDIPLKSIDVSFLIDDQIAYLKINRFSATTTKEFYKNTQELIKGGMKKMILDLRGNPGGYLGSAIAICDEFFESEILIVYTEGRMRPKQEIFSSNNGLLKNIEIIVLINEGSASASEIVAGALQDNDRGIIIGKRSFGKGLVQEEIRLSDGSAVRITTQRYYTPSGRSIQKPYNNNTDYFLETYKRKTDSISYDRKEYKTIKGRTVYGGGGITPDIKIKRDTSLNYSKINFLISKGWLSKFSISESQKDEFQNYSNYQDFIDRLPKHSLLTRFENYIQQKEKNFTFDMGKIETEYLQTLLKANLARNIWGNESYYQILIQDDEYVERAIKELDQRPTYLN